MQEILFIIGQSLGIVAIVLGFINYQMKTRKQVLFMNWLTALCFTLHYMFIGAYVGMAMNFVACIRNVVFYYAGKEGKVGRVWAILFAVIMGITGVLNWEAWYSIFAVSGLVINTYAMSMTNPNSIRKSILITSPLMLVYDSFVLSFGGMIYEGIVIVSSIIGIWRFRKSKSN